jgi:hypothetical protein
LAVVEQAPVNMKKKAIATHLDIDIELVDVLTLFCLCLLVQKKNFINYELFSLEDSL